MQQVQMQQMMAANPLQRPEDEGDPGENPPSGAVDPTRQLPQERMGVQ